MGFYAFLTVATAAITALAWLIWRKTRNPGFLIGIAALYYWSLYGAWSIVTDQLGGDSGMRYHYLYKKMFAVYLDGDYLMSLMLYTLFVLVVELSILLVARKADSVNHVPRPIEISHPIIIVVGLLAAAGSYLFIRDGLQAAALMNKAAYHVTRGLSRDEVVPFYTLHQLLNRVALYPAVIGIAVWFSGSSPRLIRARRTPWVLPLYFALCAWMFAFAMVLGNKNDLLVPGITGVLFYVANSERPNYGGLVVLGCAGLIGLWMIDLLRGTPFPQFLQAVQNLDFDRLQEAVAEGSASNEAFGAHFSMYGSLIYDVAPTWGSSIVSLLASAVPRVFWPDRPDEIYVYYADQVNAVAGQGYAIHHATGWYLNFGVAGILIGAMILGVVWATCANAYLHASAVRSRLLYLLAVLSPCTFAAYVPDIVRAGPEVYKGVTVEAFLIPAFVLYVASLSWSTRRTRRALPQALPAPLHPCPADS
jgi:hypothetical protein